MKKKTKKNLLTLLVLALVLAALIIGAVLLKNINAEEEETPEEDNFEVIFDKGSTIVTNIHFKTDDNEMSFSYVNEDWVYDADNNFPLDQDSVAAMAQSVGEISATVTLKDPSEDLSDYGLSSPSITVDATYSDKSKKTFIFGDKNGFNSCIYFMIEGDKNVYMVEEVLSEPFAADLDYLYEPEIYTLQKEGVTYDEVTKIFLSTTKKDSTTVSKEITDDTGIYELYELLYTLDLSDYEDYYADSEEMKADYGITPEGERFTVSYTVDGKDKEYTVYIGHKFEAAKEESAEGADTTDSEEKESHSYFYTFEGSNVVYSADGETVDEIFTYLTYTPKADETTSNGG